MISISHSSRAKPSKVRIVVNGEEKVLDVSLIPREVDEISALAPVEAKVVVMNTKLRAGHLELNNKQYLNYPDIYSFKKRNRPTIESAFIRIFIVFSIFLIIWFNHK